MRENGGWIDDGGTKVRDDLPIVNLIAPMITFNAHWLRSFGIHPLWMIL